MADLARRTTAVALAAAAWLAAPALSAEPDAQADVVTASLELLAPAGCGSESGLAQAIRARSDRIHLDEGSNASRRLRVELREDDSGLVITLTLVQPNGRRSTRTLRASSCAEALDAAALVAALSLDPTASTRPAIAVEPPPVPVAAAAPVCPPCEREKGKELAPSRVAPHVEVATLVTFQAILGPAPGVMPGFGGVLQIAYERDDVLSPALRLSYSHFARGDFQVTGGVADFALDAGTLELCPARAEAGPWRIYPCLRGTGGELRASGSQTVGPSARGRPWWEVGAAIAIVVHPSRSLELGLTLAAGWPLVRDTFQFEPFEFHAVSALALTGGLGAGVRFP